MFWWPNNGQCINTKALKWPFAMSHIQLGNFTANQMVSLLKCNLPGNSQNSRVLWKSLLTKLSFVLDPALDILADQVSIFLCEHPWESRKTSTGPTSVSVLKQIEGGRLQLCINSNYPSPSPRRQWSVHRRPRFWTWLEISEWRFWRTNSWWTAASSTSGSPNVWARSCLLHPEDFSTVWPGGTWAVIHTSKCKRFLLKLTEPLQVSLFYSKEGRSLGCKGPMYSPTYSVRTRSLVWFLFYVCPIDDEEQSCISLFYLLLKQWKST